METDFTENWETNFPSILDKVVSVVKTITTQKMKFFIMGFFNKCDQIHRKLQIWSHLLKKTLIENFIFCAVYLRQSFNGVSKIALEISTAYKVKFSIKDFFSKCDRIRSFLQMWSHLPKKSLMENFIFWGVKHDLYFN